MSCDVLVLGGGIVGLACARELAGEGLRVEVLDSEPILAADGWRGASWAAAGMLAPLSEAPEAGALFDAARASRDLWPGFARELREESDLAVDHDASGALMAALTPEEEPWLDRLVAAGRRLGETVHEISPPAARAEIPDLPPATRRVLHLPGEHRVDNRQACRALEVAVERRGVPVLRDHRVHRVEVGTAGITAHGHGWQRSAERLVVAAGAWSGSIPGLPPLPLEPVRGQMLRFEDAAWPWAGTLRGAGIYAVRRGTASVLVGATEELVGFDRATTPEGRHKLVEAVRRLLPALARSEPAEHWAGLRPGTPDHLPILGPLAGEDPRLLVATGHYRHGILMAPWTAREITSWVLGRTPDAAALHFGVARLAELSGFGPPV
ncbi:MAG: glycine oxidase ThiO [Acidobacteria bacterium]|nr:glycine oxidase ThiO [Acidobacteriota bacterium]